MAQVVVDGRVVEVSDVAIELEAYGWRNFLQGRLRSDVAGKIRYIRKRLRRNVDSAVEVEALKRVLIELQKEAK